MRKIMTFILFASLANNIACSSGFERAIPKNLKELVASPIEPNTTVPEPPKEQSGKNDTTVTRVTPTLTGGSLGNTPVIHMKDNSEGTPNSVVPDGNPDLARDVGPGDIRKLEKADAEAKEKNVAGQTVIPKSESAAAAEKREPGQNDIRKLEMAAATVEKKEPGQTVIPKSESAPVPASKTTEAITQAQSQNQPLVEVETSEKPARPLEWAFSELRVVLPDTLVSTTNKDVKVVIANNALMTESTAKFRLAGQKSYMLCRSASKSALAKKDTFTFAKATQKEWPADKRATIATLTFENKLTKNILWFSCLIFGSKTEVDFKANMRDIVEFRNVQGLYN